KKVDAKKDAVKEATVKEDAVKESAPPKDLVARDAPKEAPVLVDAPPLGAPAPSALAEPPGAGFALQITALQDNGEAETTPRRLSAKGYAAYVLNPSKGSPSVYRVRIGKFKTRREAEAISTRLQKEEQFTPWVTR